jgi:hypothetical protein
MTSTITINIEHEVNTGDSLDFAAFFFGVSDEMIRKAAVDAFDVIITMARPGDPAGSPSVSATNEQYKGSGAYTALFTINQIKVSCCTHYLCYTV